MKSKKQKYKLGERLEIFFDDHCETDGSISEPLPCKLLCYFIEEKPDHYKVAGWVTDNELVGPNTQTFTILKNTNVRIRKLR